MVLHFQLLLIPANPLPHLRLEFLVVHVVGGGGWGVAPPLSAAPASCCFLLLRKMVAFSSPSSQLATQQSHPEAMVEERKRREETLCNKARRRRVLLPLLGELERRYTNGENEQVDLPGWSACVGLELWQKEPCQSSEDAGAQGERRSPSRGIDEKRRAS